MLPVKNNYQTKVELMSNSEQNDPLDGIAVIGMAGRFPMAANIDELWLNLCQGNECITFFKAEEIDPSIDITLVKNPDYIKARGVLKDIDKFDAAFFGLTPREAEIMDPQQRIFLEVAWEAIENAGYCPGSMENLTGIFAGKGNNSYFTNHVAAHRKKIQMLGEFQSLLLNEKDYLPLHTSYHLNLKGPSISIHTGCSTSLVAVCAAFDSLMNYQCDMALAGGISLVCPQRCGFLYQEGAITSRDGHCRPFDAEANGTVSSEGAGVVVLKRYEEALKDKDNIYAVIKGTGVNNDGTGKMSFMAPSVEGQSDVISTALANAEVSPETISFVEAHGTATPLGDPIEIEALTQAFRLHTTKKNFCAVGSIKSNLGHLDAAAGITGFIKATLSLYYKKLPANIHFEKPNPQIDFDSSPFYVSNQLINLENGQTPLRAGISAFGVGGTNAHVILEEAPVRKASSESRPLQLLLFSAKTETAMDKVSKTVCQYLDKHSETPLADAAYTLQIGRPRFKNRRFIVCKDPLNAITAINTMEGKRIKSDTLLRGKSDIAFLFPGQGSQYVNMGLNFYKHEVEFRETIDECAGILEPLIDKDIRKIIYPKNDNIEYAAGILEKTAYNQPALFMIEYALSKLWNRWGIQQKVMIGHSIGEYVAACLAGVFSLKDALQLVAARGQLMQNQPEGAMLSICLSAAEISTHLSSDLSLAASNGPNLSVVAGSKEAIEKLKETLDKKNIVCRILNTSHAFHSYMMDDVIEPFKQVVSGIQLSAPEIPFVSTVTGKWITADQAIDPAYWARQIRSTVLFSEGLNTLWEDPDCIFLEVGPRTTSMTIERQQAKDISRQVIIPSLSDSSEHDGEWEAILNAAGQLFLAGVDLDWEGFYQHENRLRVALPGYAFDKKSYWLSALPYDGGQRQGQSYEYDESMSETSKSKSILKADEDNNDIFDEVLNLFEELSGIELKNIDNSLSFLEIGFDSLSLTQCALAVNKKFNVNISFRNLLDNLSTIKILSDYIANLKRHEMADTGSAEDDTIMPAQIKSDGSVEQIAIQRLKQTENELKKNNSSVTLMDLVASLKLVPAESQATSIDNDLVPLSGEREYPLSFSQERLWCLDQLEPDSTAYNLPFAIRFKGNINKDALQKSINEIIRRHESLRTTFLVKNDIPVQQIAASLTLNLDVVSYDNDSSGDRESKLKEYLKKEGGRSFNLNMGPLVRASLIKLNDQTHILFFMPHHIIFDGWSFSVFQRELFALYNSFVRDEPSLLNDPEVQYKDFTIWQQKFLENDPQKGQMDYWRKQLSGSLPILQLPIDFPRPSVQSYRGKRDSLYIPKEMMGSLTKIGQKENATFFMVLLSSFYVLLYRYTGQDDICIGAPIANRRHPKTKDLIGYFINNLVLRVQLQEDLPFVELLKVVKKTCLDAYSNQDIPFEQLVKELRPIRDLSRTPIYQALFVFQGVLDHDMELADLSWQLEEIETSVSQTDISLWGSEKDGGFNIDIEYSADLFRADTIKRMINNFSILLKSVVAKPEKSISELSLLSDEEKRKEAEWNLSVNDYDRKACIHELFERQVEKTPDLISLKYNNTSLTYKDLNQQANQLSQQIRKFNVQPEMPIGIYVNRSLEMAVGLLGILKSGGAYVPLDPAFPKERLSYMLSDSKMEIVLTQKVLLESLKEIYTGEIILLDSEKNEDIEDEVQNPVSITNSENLAYTIYTSGSTGKPKGVQISHQAFVNFLVSMKREPGLLPNDKLLSVTTMSFDIFGLELFLPLIIGARTIIVDQEIASNGSELIKHIEENKATVMQATPATWSLMLEAGWKDAKGLKVLCGGEALSRDLADRILETGAELWNLYGPTETTVWSAVSQVEPGVEQPRIGKPIDNTQLYVLDHKLRPLPIGAPGELCIGGDGLARGYLNQDKLTAEKFLASPFNSGNGDLIYKTGDLVRRLNDGSLEFLGRLDHQVKIRGLRIELGEIESLLNQHHLVVDSVVLAREDVPGEKRLVAYLECIPGELPEQKELRDFLRDLLPAYMVPSIFVLLDKFPLTPNGKKDRKALPKPTVMESGERNDFVPPRDQLERKLVNIWQKLLNIKSISIYDDFFDLGGHSLLAARLFAEIERDLGMNLPLASLFAHSKIAELADLMRQEELELEWSPLVSIRTGGNRPPLFLVHGAEGNVLLYRSLSHHLGQDQPVYGLQSEGLSGIEGFMPRVKDMATRYLNEIRTVQPTGPYYLGGYCLGGVIVFEMAQQLYRQGEKVNLIAMIECYNVHINYNYLSQYYLQINKIQNIIFHLLNLLSLDSKDMWRFFRQKFQVEATRVRIWLNLKSSKITGKFKREDGLKYYHTDIAKGNDQAYLEYFPEIYPGKITLFNPKKNYTGFEDPYFGWQGLAEKGLEIHQLPNYPRGTLVEPFVKKLADQINSCISEKDLIDS